jgi:hypothetical protein
VAILAAVYPAPAAGGVVQLAGRWARPPSFAQLADGGEVVMPLEEVFWATRFGACTDGFDTAWMISVDLPTDAA